MAWFTFTDASNETFVVRLEDPSEIAHARALLAGTETSDPRIGGTVVKAEAAYNIGWSYHLDPESVFFFEIATEVGDSTMRYIEDHLDEVGGELLPGSVWTGWSSVLLDELQAKAGGAGADMLVGSPGADILFGKPGNDCLFGRSGDDHLVAGAGDDKDFGGLGDDKLGGGAGDDILLGDRGRDILVGGSGDDRLHGGAGQDRLDGGAGDDRLAGGGGSDIFVFAAGAGADTISRFADGRGRADDRVDVSAYGFGSVREIGIARDGADVVLTLGGGDTVRFTDYLLDHALADLGAADFIL
jgi:Ca2+-binding RTX toxin-like protein